ncbi:MAG: flagellar motor protein MotB [Acidimicrobiales bacterium]
MSARRKKAAHEEEHENHERWLITYADMITLLMVLFIVLYSIGQVDLAKFEKLRQGLPQSGGGAPAAGVSVLEGGKGVLDGTAFSPAIPLIKSAAAAEAALVEKQAQKKAFEKEQDTLQQTKETIEKELAEVGLSDAAHFRLETRGLIVSIASDRVLFDTGSDIISSAGAEVLNHLVSPISRVNNKVSVEGHTDNTPINGGGRFPTNWELSTARATSVARHLESQGISSPRLSAVGYGEFTPIESNETPEGRAANRRVEIVVHATVQNPNQEGA